MGTVYATAADFSRLGLPPLAYASLSEEQVEAALEQASAKADSYIGTRFELPLTAYSPALTECVCELAAYALMTQRGWQPGASDIESVGARHDKAIKWLEDVARGRALPAYPDTVDTNGFNPQQQPGVLVSATGGIGLADGSSGSGSFVEAGTIGAPTGRGW